VTPAPAPTTPEARAASAEAAVTSQFTGRLLGVPGTHLAQVSHPAPPFVGGSWNYWWQAHYLDAVVDAGLRALRAGDREGADRRARLGHRLVGTIRVRNVLRFTNHLYDDMAWLALAVDRLRLLRAALDRPGTRRLRTAERVLTTQLRSAMTDDLGGGLFWSTRRDFKNTPATGPAALHLARLGDTAAARSLVDWLYDRLLDGERGLFLDGIRLDGPARTERMVTDVYTYNQGTVLGTLVTLGDATSLERATHLVAACRDHLTTAGPPGSQGRPLRTHGDGDGGLFTGILVRYLALAAQHPGLAAETRSAATTLVDDTADALWWGHGPRSDDDPRLVFSPDPVVPAAASQPPGSTVELSTQLQAWMTFEAQAVLRAQPSTR
jgi:predicted alpha-1,6-mannanase (GH76 family)